MVPLSPEDLSAHAAALASTLVEENRDYISAAHIQAEHLHDIPTAARLLCRGSQFADATRLLALHGYQSLIPEIIDTGLADAMGSTTDLLSDFRSQLNAQVPRIHELRVRRAIDPLAFFGGDPSSSTDPAAVADIPDNVSLAPTETSTLAGRSLFTRYSGKTGSSRQSSKNRRREERKRASGKKGTVYEEEYLINSVRRLIERVNSTIAEVEGLVNALLRRGMRERAAAVERTLGEVLKLCVECREEVFEAEQQQQPDGGGEQDGNPDGELRAHAEALFLGGGGGVASSAGSGSRDVPVVKEMKKSALLS